MKVLLLSPDNRRRKKLIHWLRKHHAIVVGAKSLKGIQILEEIARCNPHLVAFAEDWVDADTAAVLAFIAQKFRSLALVRLPFVSGDREVPYHWTDRLRKQLRVPLVPWVAAPYGAETRLVFHDSEFQNFSKGDRMVAGSLGIERQCGSLFCLLDGAKQNHTRAKAYLTALEATLCGLEPELAYRIVHRSYKGLIWGRSLVAKFASVLSHYVPGVQVAYLPLPAPIHPSLDYVHYLLPPEDRYALNVLCRMQINREVEELLVSSSQWIFTGQSGVILLAEQCQLLGLALFLRQIAHAHIAVMERWLLPPETGDEEETPCDVLRQLQIMRDFWDWGGLWESKGMISHLLRAYHDGSWQPDFLCPSIPAYADFVEALNGGVE